MSLRAACFTARVHFTTTFEKNLDIRKKHVRIIIGFIILNVKDGDTIYYEREIFYQKFLITELRFFSYGNWCIFFQIPE